MFINKLKSFYPICYSIRIENIFIMKRQLSSEQNNAMVDVRELYIEEDKRKQIDLKIASNEDVFKEITKKRKVFDYLVTKTKGDWDQEPVSRFMTSAEYACSWCKTEYGLTTERVSAFVSVCDNVEECLLVLGGDNKKLNYLLTKHPNEKCPFVEGRLKRMLILNENDYEAATPERQTFSDYIISRGFLDYWTLDKLINQYIKTGARMTAIRNLMEEKKITNRLRLSHDAGMDQFYRVLDYYSSLRRHILQLNHKIKDSGVVRISTTFSPHEDDCETEILVDCKRNASINVVFPDYELELFRSSKYVPDFMNRCFHTYQRLEQANTLINVLRERYDVVANIEVPDDQKCYCLTNAPYPTIPNKHEMLPTTAEKPVIYEHPTGLMKDC